MPPHRTREAIAVGAYSGRAHSNGPPIAASPPKYSASTTTGTLLNLKSTVINRLTIPLQKNFSRKLACCNSGFRFPFAKGFDQGQGVPHLRVGSSPCARNKNPRERVISLWHHLASDRPRSISRFASGRSSGFSLDNAARISVRTRAASIGARARSRRAPSLM